jgi:hypothetical protein
MFKFALLNFMLELLINSLILTILLAINKSV